MTLFYSVLDFFPELRENRRHWSDYDDYQDGFDSMDDDVQGMFEDYNTIMDPHGSGDDDASSSVPHYEVSSSQASMFQTPRQAGSSSTRRPPARKHAEARFYSYPDIAGKQKHHHHHHHRHHHHHHSSQSHNSSQSRSSNSTLRPGRSTATRQLSNTGSAISSVIIGNHENVDDLFAYDAGDGAGESDDTYANQAHAGTSDHHSQDHQGHLHIGAALANLANSADETQVKSESAEVKAEQEDQEFEPM